MFPCRAPVKTKGHKTEYQHQNVKPKPMDQRKKFINQAAKKHKEI